MGNYTKMLIKSAAPFKTATLFYQPLRDLPVQTGISQVKLPLNFLMVKEKPAHSFGNAGRSLLFLALHIYFLSNIIPSFDANKMLEFLQKIRPLLITLKEASPSFNKPSLCTFYKKISSGTKIITSRGQLKIDRQKIKAINKSRNSWFRLSLITCLLFLLCALSSNAQNLSNWRTKSIPFQFPEQQIDSLSIIPNSITIFDANSGKQVEEKYFQLLHNSILWSKDLPTRPLEISIRYRVFAFDLSAKRQHLDPNLIQQKEGDLYIGYDYSPHEDQSGLLDFKGLDYNGSFSRGISFGNKQSLVLNSSFNLQLSGEIGDDIEILAAISDANIPLQPDGNTQQLQEFDKVFIQLSRKENSLIAGDYELDRPDSYFMNYYKKLQGATFANKTKILDKGVLSSKASIAIARGKFARNIIQQQEGNQGPYRLTGGEGERFIIVLAGTEKVFIDDKLMARGIENDYVMDYNSGDIRFTTNRMITKDSRIIIEFEYADQNYMRSLYAINTSYTQGRLKLHANVYSEQDSKNTTNQNELSEETKEAFRTAGDQADSIFINPAIEQPEDGFNENYILYKLVPNPINQEMDSILIYSTHPDSAIYLASFYEVGFGNGDYVQLNNAVNGRVYTWVEPDSTGTRQGNFIPARKLAAPNKQQLFTFGGEYDFGKKTKVKSELALSNFDPNRFSELDTNNDKALPGMVQFQKVFTLDKICSTCPPEKRIEKKRQLTTNAAYEFAQKDFKALNPYRSAEFVRDWNLSNNASGLSTSSRNYQNEALEQLGNFNIAFTNNNSITTSYAFATFVRNGLYNGTKHAGLVSFKKAGFALDASGSFLQSDGYGESTRFLRPKAELSKTFLKLDNWKIGLYAEQEKNERFATDSLGTDTLKAISFYYDLYQFYVESPVKSNFSLKANYNRRYDYKPVKDNFQQITSADNVNLSGQWSQKAGSKLSWNFNFRNLDILQTELTEEVPLQTYLGRADYNLQLFQKTITSVTGYELGSGQEPVVAYEYIKTPNSGEGTYLWQDYNEDGIEDLTEFEVATNQDQADYIRIAINTNDFIRTNKVFFTEILDLNPWPIWRGKKGILKFMSRLSTKSTFRINRKTLKSEAVTAWNPFQLDIDDSALVSVRSNIINTFYFNRHSQIYNLQIGMSDNRTKNLLTIGYDAFQTSRRFFRSHWNITQKLSTDLSLSKQEKVKSLESLDGQNSSIPAYANYNILSYALEPSVRYLPHKSFSANLQYSYKESRNRLGDLHESAFINNFSLAMNYRKTTKTRIELKLTYALIRFNGTPNSPVEFAMLEALKDGKNYQWNCNFSRKLAKNINLIITYEGRKSGEVPIVHVGGAQVRASF